VVFALLLWIFAAAQYYQSQDNVKQSRINVKNRLSGDEALISGCKTYQSKGKEKGAERASEEV
jgi:hypothetical protein